MKAFTKFCLILCAVLVILGVAGIGAGLAMGVRPAQLLDLAHVSGPFQSRIAEDIGETEDIPEEIDDMEEVPEDIEDAENFLPDSSSKEPDSYYEFDNRINELNFDLTLCDLEIRSHGKDYVALEANNTGTTFQCEQEQYTLTLKDDRNRLLWQDSMDHALSLTLYLPEQTLDDIDIKVGAGSITLNQLAADKIQIKCAVGELEAGELNASDMDIQMGIGEVHVDTLKAGQKCKIDSGTGDITLGRFDGPELDLNCAVGSVSVTASGRASQYDYDLNCTAGEIQMAHPVHESGHHHENEDGIGCSIKTDNNTGRMLNMQCGMGDIALHFTEED